MSDQLANLDPNVIASLVTEGDCSKLSAPQKVAYYNYRCQQAGVDPATQPFEYIRLSGKLVLYARKGCTDQLSAAHGIVCEIVSQVTENDMRVATVRARTKDGRQTDEIGVVPIKGLVLDGLANAMMKAVTKAKRRAVLSLTGLGMADESEIDPDEIAKQGGFITNLPPRQIGAEPPKVAPEVTPHDRIMLVWNNGESGKAIVNTLKAKLYPGVKAGLTDEQKVPMADACDAAAAFAAWFTPESTLDVIARTAPESVTKVLREAVAVEEAKSNEAATV